MSKSSSLPSSARRSIWTSSGSVLLLLAISGLAILGLVFLAAVWAGSESDSAALDRQRKLVNSRLQDQVDRVAQEITLIGAGYATLLTSETNAGNATSTEAFAHITTELFGYNGVFIVTPSGELALQSNADSKRRYKWIRPLLKPMIRDLEAARMRAEMHPLAPSQPAKVELMRLEGRPSVAGAISISGSPTGDRFVPRVAPRYYLVAFRFLDGAALDALSREQGLAGARYARTADEEAKEVAYQIEATASSEPIGFIIWTPDLPGSRVVGRLIPLLTVAGLAIAGLFFALMIRLRRTLRELGASEQHARHLSVHDVLTGLPNRALFAARFEECLVEMKTPGMQSVLALIDLDRFKEVNDLHGHPVGDELLRAAVARMRALIEPTDTLARVGGDEFALLLPGRPSGAQTHRTLAQAMIEAVSRPYQLREGNALISIGCSIGIATFADDSLAAGEISRRADVALYEAKSSGRGRLMEYDPSLDHRSEWRERLKTDLRLVLATQLPGSDGPRDATAAGGKLEVFFQGVHDGQGNLAGAEALVRWRHPVDGLLSPDKFIPIAEEAGMMDQLGEWVLWTAARAAASWPATLTIAVNVSPSQIRRSDFHHRVLAVLSQTGLPPARLELEITEAALFDIDEQAQARLSMLRAHGVQIALDDFGTGFSSLSHLIQFNIDRIKIDRSFVRLLGSQADGAAIVSAIVSLSHTLGKATTAEGVETEGQRDYLIAAGCSHLQGYLLSRPVPLLEFESAFQLTEQDGGRKQA